VGVGGVMANNRPPLFFCPNCKALFQVVKQKPGRKTSITTLLAKSAKHHFPLAKEDLASIATTT
jgi:hypothetical protein